MKLLDKFLKEEWYNKIIIIIGFILWLAVVLLVASLLWLPILIVCVIGCIAFCIQCAWSFYEKQDT